MRIRIIRKDGGITEHAAKIRFHEHCIELLSFSGILIMQIPIDLIEAMEPVYYPVEREEAC